MAPSFSVTVEISGAGYSDVALSIEFRAFSADKENRLDFFVEIGIFKVYSSTNGGRRSSGAALNGGRCIL